MAERRKLETILTANGLVSEEQLKPILRYAQAVGIDLHEAVLQKKIAPPEDVMQAYAESVGIPFVHIDDLSFDEGVVARVAPMTARQYSFVPVSIDQGHVLLATTKPIIPDVADELRMTFNLPVRCVICTPAELSAAIAKYYPRDAVRSVVVEPEKVAPPPTSKEKPKSVEPMSDDEKKTRLWKTIIAFNFAFAFVFFALSGLPLPRGIWNQYPMLFAAVTGIVAAGATWKTLSR
jgi:hypothetical protein